jgi:D-alanyl-D-alanine carboxypeptidase
MRSPGLLPVCALLLFASLVAQLDLQAPASQAISPISNELCDDMKSRKVLTANSLVGCERLRLLSFNHIGFDRQLHDGEIVVMDAVANNVVQIFNALLSEHFPIEKAKLLNSYEGDDDASIADNNTSAFNDRNIAGGAGLSLHAYGLAIDVNPLQNPYIEREGETLRVSPKLSSDYVNRTNRRPGMVEPIVDVFADNGFSIWGGDWRNPIDYQHFQVSRDLANQLVGASASAAKEIFAHYVAQYSRCRQAGRDRKLCTGNP